MDPINNSQPYQIFTQKCKEKKLACPLCFEPYKDPYAIKNCLHTFCQNCILETQKKQKPCPQCKKPFNSNDLIHNRDIQNRVEEMLKCVKKVKEVSVSENNSIEYQQQQQQNMSRTSENCCPLSSDQNPYRDQQQPKQSSIGGPLEAPTETIDQRDFFQARARNFFSIQTRNGIALERCTVRGSAKTSYGNVETKASILAEVEARQDVSLVNCEIESAESSSGSIKIRLPIGKIQSLIARQKVDIEDAQVHKIKSSYGGLEAKNCCIDHVKTRSYAMLTNCNGGSVEVEYGQITIRSNARYEFNSLEAREGLSIQNIRVNKVQSFYGALEATQCDLGKVKTREGATLTNCNGSSVEVDYGKIIIHSDNDKKCLFYSLKAREGLDVNNVSVKNVQSSYGTLEAKNSSLGIVKTRKGATLTNCDGDSVEVEYGPITLLCDGRQERQFRSLKAREKITLDHMSISDSVNSTYGAVHVKNSILGKCECLTTLELHHSVVGSATVTCPSDIQTVNITLNQGTIEGDLYIVAQTDSLVSYSSNFFISSAGSNITIFSETISETIYGGRSKLISVNGINYRNEGKSISLSGVSYPLSNNHVNILTKNCSCPLKFSSSGYLMDTQGYKVTINGKEIFPTEKTSEAPAALRKVVVMITGTGTIQGNIKFDGCTGDVRLSSGVQHLGKIT